MTFVMRRFRPLVAMMSAGLLIAGCSSGSGSNPPPPSPGASASPTPTPTPTMSAAPTSVGQRPCDIYAGATPCVAAYSTTRSLYAAYAGPLYSVTRQSDGTTMNVGLLANGYANAPSQDAFCANTTCTITELYDQSASGNNLTVAPPGGHDAGSGPNGDDLPAVANALPVTAAGNEAYGISIVPGMGYRDDATTNIPKGSQPQGVYMVTSSLNVGEPCCFDFGNAETSNDDTGAGNMDAINIICRGGNPCGDQAGLDLENGIYGSLPVPAGLPFVTDMGSNDGSQYYTIWQGNAQSGALTTTGPVPLPAGYSPMQQQGAIILGIGGDNSDYASGSFFEGVVTQGTPTNAVMNSVQANIVAVAYSTAAMSAATRRARGPGRR